ncbi:hypothetical protein [Chryseobacterium viscerum]|uniref:Lipoprotein n=1 Tax=Chryseobacterium viscerum TaxID=1037377 RepID=A0A316WGC2_9FLAO|nr:hypothetical protein [Chryseobacterium viscerum]PWN60481.1 hypothetical protein C1634_016190 [Chryseobacterium viscerum]
MRKKMSLRLSLLIALFATLWSCRNDYLPDQQENDYNAFRYTYKRISLEESKHKINLIPELKKVNEKLKTREAYASGKAVKYSNGVSVNTDDVIYIERGPNVHSYTFHITRDNEPENAPLENLVLSILPDGTYKELLITYDFTSQEKQILMNDGSVDTKGKLNVEELNPGTYNGGGLVNKSDISCQWIEESYFTSCSEGQHFNGEASQSQGGPCKADQPSKMVTVVIHRCKVLPASTALGDDGTGGGGGPFGGPGGNNNGTPTIPNFIHPRNTPCGRLKTQNQNADFKAKVTELDKKEMFDKEQETGFAAAYGTVSYEQMLNTPNGNVKLPDGNKYFGFMHVHLNLDGVVKIFSPYDITTFLTSCVTNAKLTGNMLDTYAMVITSQGNYILKYSGDGNFAITYGQLESWQTWYDKQYSKLYTADELTQENVEKVFAQFLKEQVNIIGLEIYKSDKTTGNTSRLEYDGKDNPVKLIPCP